MFDGRGLVIDVQDENEEALLITTYYSGSIFNSTMKPYCTNSTQINFTKH